MKKICTLLLISLSLFTLSSSAQSNTTCNPGFTFYVDGNAVQFKSADSIYSRLIQHYWFFDDGYTSSFADAFHVYYSAGFYEVKHVIKHLSPNDTTIVTCADSSIQQVTINRPLCYDLNADFYFDAVAGQPNTIHFRDISQGITANTIATWNFGDSSSVSVYGDSAVNHTYRSPGTYKVCLSLKRDNFCTDDTCILVQVPAGNACNLVAQFAAVQDTANPLLMHFYNSSAGFDAGDSIRWNFGDGSVSNDINPSHLYTNPGNYNVCIRVKKVTQPGVPSCVKEHCLNIQVWTPPPCTIHASFTIEKDSVQANKIHFYNLSTGITPGTLVSWSFGDGIFSDNNNPVHTYSQPGAYTVCLKLRKDSVCATDTCMMLQVQNTVNTCNLLVAGFTPIPDSLNPLVVHFTNLCSPFTVTDSIRWSFGDGSTSNAINPVHQYADSGTYNVCMRIKIFTQQGTPPCIRELCGPISVKHLSQCNLEPGFSFYNDTMPGNRYHFINTTTGLQNGDSTTWNFGDGTISTNRDTILSHVYTTPGTYSICLTVKKATITPNSLCEKTVCHTVVVHPVSACNLSVDFNSIADSANGKKISFFSLYNTGSSQTTVQWNFGDGADSTGFNTGHTYQAPGQYQVCMKVTTDSGCVKDTCKMITILPTQADSCHTLVNFAMRVDSLNGYKVHVYNTSANAAEPRIAIWSFGDSTSAGGWNDASHIYTHAGTYTVCLTVVTGPNCRRVWCDTVNITGIIANPANCDSTRLEYTYRRDSYMPNKFFFTANSNSNIRQQNWTFIKLSNSASETSSQYNPVHLFTDTGAYYACLKADFNNGCVKEYCSAISITDTLAPAQCILQAFPNPSHENVSVNLELQEPQLITASAYSLENVLVLQKIQGGLRGNNTVTLSVQNLVPGFYTVRLVYGSKVCYTRFQKI